MVATARGRKNQRIDEAGKTQVLNKVAAMDANSLNNEFSAMQLSIQRTFAGLQADVTNRFATCEELDTAITLKQARLKDLHSIEATAVQLDDLQAQLEAQHRAIEEERQQADQEHADQVNAWNRDKKRVEDEWAYNTDQKHRKTLDEFNQALLKQQRDEATRQEQLQKNWKDREDQLTEREAELDALRQQVEAFPAKVDSEVKKAVAINENSIKREYETKIQLLTKDNEANAKLNAERETAFKGTIVRMEQQNAALHEQVRQAETRAADIAKTAFESVSGRDALAAVQRNHTETQQQQSGKSGR